MDGPCHNPVDTSKAEPSKSILKKKHSHDCDSHCSNSTADSDEAAKRRAQWDEMNILATYHPADKDYGHMKIDDPPTPYHEYTQEEDDTNMDTTDSTGGYALRERKASFSDTAEVVLDPATLAEKLSKPFEEKPTKVVSSDSEDESKLTEEERKKKEEFKKRRRQHYNEFQVCMLPSLTVSVWTKISQGSAFVSNVVHRPS